MHSATERCLDILSNQHHRSDVHNCMVVLVRHAFSEHVSKCRLIMGIELGQRLNLFCLGRH